MRILVVGVGATGGYFGARLLAAGRDVTFLVRPDRAEALRRSGLKIFSRFGDLAFAAPPLATPETLSRFDLVVLSCKAYDLAGAMEAFAGAVGPGTVILPLLNGMRHMDALTERFGAEKLIGGLCHISATRGADGAIHHLNDLHALTFGALDAGQGARVAAIADQLVHAGFDARLSEDVRRDMWEKWIFIAALGAVNCLMRASVGDIVAAGAETLALQMFEDCAAIAAANGFAPRAAFCERTRAMLTAPGSPIMASMLRDLEAGGRIEGDQILGDLLRRAPDTAAWSPLRIACAHVRAYEIRILGEKPA